VHGACFRALFLLAVTAWVGAGDEFFETGFFGAAG
jgi:hypothetical protein